jgi:hypothetical protein
MNTVKPIDTGTYAMRGGGVAEITELGTFAYGKRRLCDSAVSTEDFWQLDGQHVPLRPAPQPTRPGFSRYDLVRRIS